MSKLEDIKPGSLISYNLIYSPKFCEVKNGIIQNNGRWGQRVGLECVSILMAIKKLDLTMNSSVGNISIISPAASFRLGTDWSLAEDYWTRAQKIPGAVFLHPNGKLIWISTVDIKYFEKI